MKILVLAKNQHTYFIKRLTEEVGNNLTFHDPWSEDYTKEKPSLVLVRTTGVYGGDRDLELLRKWASVQTINPYSSLVLFREKSTQYRFFERNQIPCLPWLDLAKASATAIHDFLLTHKRVVVKPDRGQGGWGIEELCADSFPQWWQGKVKKDDKDWLLQAYFEAEEFRVFFIQGQGLWVLKRKKTNGTAANFRAGGEAEVVQLPPHLEHLIGNLIEKSGALYGAIDLLMEKDVIQVLELNVVPGIEQIEKLTGVNMIEKIIGLFTGLS